MPRGTWVGCARERRRRETLTKEGKRESESGAVRVRDARACDEEDFRDRVTGEGMGCGREDNLVPGSPGRGGFGKWGRLFGDVSVRRQMVSGWVSWRDRCFGSHTPATTPRRRSDFSRQPKNQSLSFAFVPLSERNSQRGAHERHKAGESEKRVGVRRRAGRWV